MINIINSQLYKIFRSKMFYILLGIGVALPIVSTLSLLFVDISIEGQSLGYDVLSTLRTICSTDSNGNLLAVVGVAIIFGKLYSEGTIRNVIMAGYSRTAIFGASVISANIMALTISLSVFAVTGIADGLAYGVGSGVTAGVAFANISASLIVYILSTLTCVAITLLFVHLTQKVSGSIVFPLLIIVLLVGMVLGVLFVLTMLGVTSMNNFEWIPLIQYYVYNDSLTLSYGTYVLDWALVGKIGIVTFILLAVVYALCWNRLRTSNIK